MDSRDLIANTTRGTLRRRLAIWGPVLLLVALWADSAYNHRLFVYCSRTGGNGEVWLASERGIIGLKYFRPYHGQHGDGIYFETRSPNVTHIPGSLGPPWFHFDWGRRTGLFQLAQVYGVAIPYWAFGVVWLVALRMRSQRAPVSEHRLADTVPDR